MSKRWFVVLTVVVAGQALSPHVARSSGDGKPAETGILSEESLAQGFAVPPEPEVEKKPGQPRASLPAEERTLVEAAEVEEASRGGTDAAILEYGNGMARRATIIEAVRAAGVEVTL